MALTQVPIELSSTPGIVDNSNATAITIDSSENVLVGMTSASTTVDGLYLRPGTNSGINASGSHTLTLNRRTNDGDILKFDKDGTTVGSIQSRSGVVSTIILDPRTNGAGLTGSTNGLIPVNQAGSTADNHVDLGSSSSRFKDLYLSGGAYLGGTGSANKLDDYEEGTWTPAFTGTITAGPTVSGSSTASGTYVKVGSQVTCYFSIDFNDNSTNFGVDQRFSLEGLPFNPAQGTIASAGTWWAYASIGSGNNAFGQVGTQNDDTIYFYVTHLDGGISYGAPLIGSITFSV
jgi:hypothetical protein